MTDQILIKEDMLESYASKLRSISNQLDDLGQDLRTMNITSDAGANKSLSNGDCRLSGLASSSRISSSTARTTIRRYGTTLDSYASYVNRLAKNVERVRDTFVSSEQDLIRSVDGGSDIQRAIAAIAQDMLNLLPWAPVINPNIFQLLYGGMWTASPIGVGVGLAIGAYNNVKDALAVLDVGAKTGLFFSESGGFFNYKASVTNVTNDKLGSQQTLEVKTSTKASWKDSDDVNVWEIKDVTYMDENGNLVDEKDVTKLKQEGKLLEYTAKASASASIMHTSASGGNDYASYSAEVGVGNAETYAQVSGGLYVTKVDKNGNISRVISPGVSAEVGIGVSALEAKADGSVNLGPVELKGGAEVKVLNAEAKAGAKLGIVDGKVNAGLSASAEANFIEAGISGSASIAGVGVKGGASVTVGVGAHADVGYYDGVIKCDIGASLGLGVSVNFELDVGGAVDAGVKAVSGVVESGIETISKVVDGGTKLFKGAANGAKKFFKGLFG